MMKQHADATIEPREGSKSVSWPAFIIDTMMHANTN